MTTLNSCKYFYREVVYMRTHGARMTDDQCSIEVDSFQAEDPTRGFLCSVDLNITPNIGLYAGHDITFNYAIHDGYPERAPTVHLNRSKTDIFHANIDECGEICFNLLDEEWSRHFGLDGTIVGLLWLLDHPNLEDPFIFTTWADEEEYEILVTDSLEDLRVTPTSTEHQALVGERIIIDKSVEMEGTSDSKMEQVVDVTKNCRREEENTENCKINTHTYVPSPGSDSMEEACRALSKLNMTVPELAG